MSEILLLATAIAPLTAGAVQVVKTVFNVNGRFLPAVAVLVGVGLGAGAMFLDADLGLRLWAGGISGMAATGVFELTKQAVDPEGGE